MTTATVQGVNGSAEWSDSAPEYVQGVAALYRWALNYTDAAPFRAFLDLVGFSADEFGEPFGMAAWSDSLGYTELGLLADAMGEYASRPSDVAEWVRELLAIEGEFGA